MNKENIQVVNLSENLEYLEEVSKWIWKEWSEIHGASLGDVIYRSRHSICKSSIPQMYIALCERTGWEFLEQAPLGDGRITHVYQYNLKSNHS